MHAETRLLKGRIARGGRVLPVVLVTKTISFAKKIDCRAWVPFDGRRKEIQGMECNHSLAEPAISRFASSGCRVGGPIIAKVLALIVINSVPRSSES